MHTLRPYLTALGWLCVVAAGHTQSPYAAAGIHDARQVDAFLSELQRASREDDREALAALPGVPDAFIVWVNKGQRLEVRLERAPVGAAGVRVVHAGKGTPLNPAASDSARVVTGRALDAAEYRIEVRRLEAGDATPLPYMLAVSVR